jgi:hypothetical protein
LFSFLCFFLFLRLVPYLEVLREVVRLFDLLEAELRLEVLALALRPEALAECFLEDLVLADLPIGINLPNVPSALRSIL